MTDAIRQRLEKRNESTDNLDIERAGNYVPEPYLATPSIMAKIRILPRRRAKRDVWNASTRALGPASFRRNPAYQPFGLPPN